MHELKVMTSFAYQNYAVFLGVSNVNNSEKFMFYTCNNVLCQYTPEFDTTKTLFRNHTERDSSIYVRFISDIEGNILQIMNIFSEYDGLSSLVDDIISDINVDIYLHDYLVEIFEYLKHKRYHLYAVSTNTDILSIKSRFDNESLILLERMSTDPPNFPAIPIPSINNPEPPIITDVRVVSEEVLDLPVLDLCAICYETHTLRDSIRTSCGHQYGRSCFVSWINTVNNRRLLLCCPTCRCSDNLTFHGFC